MFGTRSMSRRLQKRQRPGLGPGRFDWLVDVAYR